MTSESKKEVIKSMLKTFSSIWPTKNIEEKTEGFIFALKQYSINEIREAGYKCLSDCTKFPVPYDIIEKINSEKFSDDKLDYEIRYDVKCRTCGHYGLGIKEPLDIGQWRCRQCYTGLTTEEIKQRLHDLAERMEYKG